MTSKDLSNTEKSHSINIFATAPDKGMKKTFESKSKKNTLFIWIKKLVAEAWKV